MTINEAISVVLTGEKNGLTAGEIYDRIIEKGLYEFGAKDPVAIVKIELCRKCKDMNYSHSSHKRIFEVCGSKNNQKLFRLISSLNDECENSESISNPESVMNTNTDEAAESAKEVSAEARELSDKIEQLKKRIAILEKEYVEAISELDDLEFKLKLLSK